MRSVADLGERKIIDIIRRRLEPMPDTPVPFGDDVSAVKIENQKLAVLKTDMLVGKTDVPPGMSLFQAARKAVVMNISDLAAKGTKPLALLAAVGIPRSLDERSIEQIGKGLNTGAREYGIHVLGGDTSETSDLVISCALFGITAKKRIMLRSGAQPGDIVAVTGHFGDAAAGLRILLQDLAVPLKLRKHLVDSVLRPHARLKEGLALSQTAAVTASIDSSDGLAWSLHEISRASGVGIEINNVPLSEEAIEFAKIYHLDPIDLGLYGGEEYELVTTIKPKLWKKAKENVTLIKIGRATEVKALVLKLGEKKFPVEARGWEHFKPYFTESSSK